jgi:prephenate dehydratase
MRVAIQGLRGSFHSEAAEKLLPGQHLELLECMSFREVFEAVQNDAVQYGVVATTNNVHGPIEGVQSLLDEFEPHILNQTTLHIDQYLIGHKTYTLNELNTAGTHVLSQLPALSQAQPWLEQHIPEAKLVETEDTAASVRQVVHEKTEGQVAVAGKHAAELCNGVILAGPLNDQLNDTSFVLFQKRTF